MMVADEDRTVTAYPLTHPWETTEDAEDAETILMFQVELD
jgi:hypothetical protein